jgi:chaperonin GroEL
VLPGGGTALLRCVSAVASVQLDGDPKVGADILKRALEEPLRQLVANAGLEGSVVVEQIRQQNQPNYGFDVLREEYVDLVEAGIIDPAKVTRSAVENAASVAGMILTTEALVTDVPEKEPSATAAPGGGPDMYG